jgi:hypothetical protein
MYEVIVKSVDGYTTHSTHESFRAAADQADMVHGHVSGEREAFVWAVANQGFAGSFGDWMAQDDEERAAYEAGAAGIPTA